MSYFDKFPAKGSTNAPASNQIKEKPAGLQGDGPPKKSFLKFLNSSFNQNQVKPYQDDQNKRVTGANSTSIPPSRPQVQNEQIRSRRPRGFVPESRAVNDILDEDKASKALYEHIFEEDEMIDVEGLSVNSVSCLTKWPSNVLNSKVLENIKLAGYVRPRNIQSYVIPLILDGYDVKAQSETGSGKSASFLIPLISKIANENDEIERVKREQNMPRCVIIAPTRELTTQLYEQAMKFANGTKVRVAKAYGEYDYGTNMKEIYRGCDIVVATPGRLNDFFTKSVVGLARLKYLVLDEADCLLSESFKDDFLFMTQIDGFPKKDELQTILFSDTFSTDSMDWIDSILKTKHVTVKNCHPNAPNSRIEQTFEECSGNQKSIKLLEHCDKIVKEYQKKTGTNSHPKILAFVNDYQKSDGFAVYLRVNEIKALSLNGKRDQAERHETLKMFRKDEINVIVCTDVCSCGLDIKELDYVINVDLPKDFQTYVHRIGRTGRLKAGVAHSFFDPAVDGRIVNDLISMFNESKTEIPEFLTDANKS